MKILNLYIFFRRNLRLKLRLFHMKTGLGKYFTLLCVFGTHWKYGQIENVLHFDRKIPLLTRKTISLVVLPSNTFYRLKKWRARERVTIIVAVESSLAPRSRSSQPKTDLDHHHPRPILFSTHPRPSSFSTHWSRSPFCSMSPIWPPPITNPLHSTPKPTRSGYHYHPSTLISLFPDLSLFPPICHSFSLRSHSFFLLLNVFILIFGCVEVYILKFSVIKFVWKLRKWLRKCEKSIRK